MPFSDFSPIFTCVFSLLEILSSVTSSDGKRPPAPKLCASICAPINSCWPLDSRTRLAPPNWRIRWLRWWWGIRFFNFIRRHITGGGWTLAVHAKRKFGYLTAICIKTDGALGSNMKMMLLWGKQKLISKAITDPMLLAFSEMSTAGFSSF